jgi:short-subunit dehydrogenase
MLDLSRSRAILTGASRGIGVVLADALAERGVELVLAARSQAGLEEVRAKLQRHGPRVFTLVTDVSRPDQLERLVEFAQHNLGEIDLLVNNAGIEQVGFYDALSPAFIEQSIAVNLTAPMLLTRMLLPAMIAADRGHILNIASIAGLFPAPFAEPYGATKHGLVGFTRALRASLQARGSAVSASVICPGFVSDTGMYRDLQTQHGFTVPPQLGTCTPDAVARASLRAIERDETEVIVNGRSLRHLVAVGSAWPRLFEAIVRMLGANRALYELARRRELGAAASTPNGPSGAKALPG